VRPRKIGDALRHSPFGGVVREVCVKIGMIAHLLVWTRWLFHFTQLSIVC
jgi:hypothetical protein